MTTFFIDESRSNDIRYNFHLTVLYIFSQLVICLEPAMTYLCNFNSTSLSPFMRGVMIRWKTCSFTKLWLCDTFKFSHFMGQSLIRITLSALAASLALFINFHCLVQHCCRFRETAMKESFCWLWIWLSTFLWSAVLVGGRKDCDLTLQIWDVAVWDDTDAL